MRSGSAARGLCHDLLFEKSTRRSDSREEGLYGSNEVRLVSEKLNASDGSPRTKHLLTNRSGNVDLAVDGSGPG